MQFMHLLLIKTMYSISLLRFEIKIAIPIVNTANNSTIEPTINAVSPRRIGSLFDGTVFIKSPKFFLMIHKFYSKFTKIFTKRTVIFLKHAVLISQRPQQSNILFMLINTFTCYCRFDTVKQIFVNSASSVISR